MPRVTVTVPGLLARFTGGDRTVRLRADTVEECLDQLVATHPEIEPHLFDGAGRHRPHLRIVHDGTAVDPRDGSTVELAAGDEVTVLQAVSGG